MGSREDTYQRWLSALQRGENPKDEMYALFANQAEGGPFRDAVIEFADDHNISTYVVLRNPVRSIPLLTDLLARIRARPNRPPPAGGKIDEKCYDLLAGAGLEPILMKRSDFLKEHKKLVDVLTKGSRKEQKAEAKEQMAEVKKQTGGDIAEDKRYINSKTPYTLAHEMTHKMLQGFYDNPEVPPSMKEKLMAAMMMKKEGVKGGMDKETGTMAKWKDVAAQKQKKADAAWDEASRKLDAELEAAANKKGNTIVYRHGIRHEVPMNDRRAWVVTAMEEARQLREAGKQMTGKARGGLAGVSKQSGFIQRMMAEIKKKHQGEPYGPNPRIPSYKKPTGPNNYGSEMDHYRQFDLNKILQEQDGGENDDDNWGPSPFLLRHFGNRGGAIAYDETAVPPTFTVTKDKKFNFKDYRNFEDFAHLLAAYQRKAPRTRLSSATVPMEAVLRMMIDEFVPAGAHITPAMIASHYNYSQRKLRSAEGALSNLWEYSGLRKAVEDAAKAAGDVKPGGGADLKKFMPKLITAVETGSEVPMLGKPFIDFLVKPGAVGYGIKGGLTEEELRARELAKKKAQREGKKAAAKEEKKSPAEREREARAATEAAEAERARVAAEEARRRREEGEMNRKIAALAKKVGNRKVKAFLKSVVAPKLVAKRPTPEQAEAKKKREYMVSFLKDWKESHWGTRYFNQETGEYLGNQQEFLPVNYRGKLTPVQVKDRIHMSNVKTPVYNEKGSAPLLDAEGKVVYRPLYSKELRDRILAAGDDYLTSAALWRRIFDEVSRGDKRTIEERDKAYQARFLAHQRKGWGDEGRAYRNSPEGKAEREALDHLKFEMGELYDASSIGSFLKYLHDRLKRYLTMDEMRAAIGI